MSCPAVCLGVCPVQPCVCCSVIFAIFFLLNLILYGKGSSAAVPFRVLVGLLALWFCVSVPLTFVGAYFGFKKRVSRPRPNPPVPLPSRWSRPITLFWKMITLFWKIITLFCKMVTLFWKMMTLFWKVIALF